MCCLYIESKCLIAWLVIANSEEQYSYEDIKDYEYYLIDAVPTYVSTNFNKDSMENTAESFPEIFKLVNNKITSNEKLPNPAYFYGSYNESMASYIQRITKIFVSDRLTHLRHRRMKAELLGVT